VKPPGMPIEQWQVEEQEFQNAVPQELRYLLPDIKERKEPLYKGDFGQALMNKFKSKFVSTEGSSEDKVKEKKPIEPFVKLEWHPAKRLCKRLNVPDPFPYSELEGIPGVAPKIKNNRDFTTTELENEVAMRGPKRVDEEKEEKKVTVEEQTEPEPLFKFFELMNEVFGTSEEDIKEGEKLEEAVQKDKEKEKEKAPEVKQEPEKNTEFRSFFDFSDDESKKEKADKSEKVGSKKVEKIKKEKSESEGSSSSTDSDDRRSKKKKKKKHKKESKKHSRKEHKSHKKSKKHKKEKDSKKKKKKRRRSDSDSSVIDVY